MKKITPPLSVPLNKIKEFKKNWQLLTANSDNLFLIAGDQKIEHLNDDFYGSQIAKEDNNPRHLFNIANNSKGGALATHLGLISQYGQEFSNLTYIVKINGKTNIGPNDEKNSSQPLWSVAEVCNFKKNSGLKIAAIGYTVYLGHKYEAEMLKQAAEAIYQAHQNGLVAILWMYPRGKGVKEEDIHTIAGGAGVAASLGADFVKIKYPYQAKNKKKAALDFKEAVVAAGKTRVICVGGSKQPAKDLLSFLEQQLTTGTHGLAIGRNLHQRSETEAYRLAQAISAMILKKANLKDALAIYQNKVKTKSNKKTKKILNLF
ncbi:aldolase [Candidatus Falkowbacteria bacterium]|nr:aldolase [Candidatus Falkowbacteria bacterium]